MLQSDSFTQWNARHVQCVMRYAALERHCVEFLNNYASDLEFMAIIALEAYLLGT